MHSIFLVALLALIGCQSNSLRDFTDIKLGMRKGQVLDQLGNPQKTRDLLGQDQWRYVFYENEQQQVRDVYFKSERVVYVGAPKPSSWPSNQPSKSLLNHMAEEKLKDEKRVEQRRLVEKYNNPRPDPRVEALKVVPEWEEI